MKRSCALLAAAALAGWLFAWAGRAEPAQTFWTLSTGPVPSPYPTPASYPVNWYGVWYYPRFWPLCPQPGTGPIRRCRPLHAPLWPPKLPAGRYPIPRPR